MVDISRRRLLAGVTTAALAGCMGDPDDRSPTQPASTPSETDEPTTADRTRTPTPEPEDVTLPEDLVAVLAPIPESVDGTAVSRVQTTAPSPDNGGTFNRLGTFGPVSQLGLDIEDVDRMAAGRYGDGRRQIVTIVGSFDADEPTLPETEPNPAVDRADGRLILAMDDTEGGWNAGLSAAIEAAEADDLQLSEDARLAASQVAEGTIIQLMTAAAMDEMSDSYGMDDGTIDPVEAFAFGGTRVDQTTVRLTITAVYTEESAFDRDSFRAFVRHLGTGGADGMTIEHEGRVANGTFTVQSPTEEIRERAPDSRFWTTYDPATGSAELQYEGDEPLETDPLTLVVDGEPVEDAWDGDVMEPEDTITVDAEALSAILVEWTDPENPEYEQVVYQHVITDGVRFTETYDVTSESLTLTYTGPAPIDRTENIEIQRRTPAGDGDGPGEQTTEPLGDRHDRLAEGDEIHFEDVTFGDRVSLMATHTYERAGASGSMSTSIHTFRARVPGRFHLENEGQPTLLYDGRESRDPANFRVTVGGSEPATGLADAHETLEPEDVLELAAEPGEKVVVEWVGEGGPAETFSEYVEPAVSFELQRTEDGFEIVYRGEQSYDADAFAVRADDGEFDHVFAEAYETLEDGDRVPVDVDGVRPIELYWTEPDEPVQFTWLSPRRALRFELDGSTLQFAGTGEWPAAEFEVTVAGEPVTGFTGTVTEDDTVDLNAETGSTVEVQWTWNSDSRVVFSETAHPPFEFSFGYDEANETLTVTSETEAELDPTELVVVVLTDDNEEYPDVWAELCDVVEKGDAVTLSVSGIDGAAVEHETWNVYDHVDLEN